MTRLVEFSEVRDNGWIVVGDGVFDVSKFAAKHPGGEAILQLCGSDATLPLVNAHGIRGEIPRLPPKFRVGAIDAASLPDTDRELREMLERLRARGMFVYKRRWLLLDAVRGLGLFAGGFVAMDSAPPLAFVLLVAALLNAMWWVHDVCHDSVFRDRAVARWWAELVSIVFVGTSILDYQYVVHRHHHGFTNTIAADPALDTGPVVWHEAMRSRTTEAFVAVQPWAWFLLVLPFTLPYFVYIGVQANLRERAYTRIACVALRWAIALWLFGDHLVVFVTASSVAAYVLGLAASLNHFHRPLSEVNDANFARSVTCVTQNLRATDRVSAWLLGGLPFHIEHHLFATMPRRNYRKIAAEVRAYCARHGLRYETHSVTEAVATLWRKLRRPFDYATSPRRAGTEIPGAN